MHITVFGASGKVGRLVVAEAQTRGHTVTVFVRRQGYFKPSNTLRVIEGDIYQSETVTRAVTGADVVISALGSWGTARKDILTVGMRHTIDVMKKQHILRIVTLTGADARAEGDQVGLVNRIMHTVLRVVAPKVLRDSENHIQQLQRSTLNWTVVRSPIMTNFGTLDCYGLTKTRPMPWKTINRLAVARCLLDCAEANTHNQKAMYISV